MYIFARFEVLIKPKLLEEQLAVFKSLNEAESRSMFLLEDASIAPPKVAPHNLTASMALDNGANIFMVESVSELKQPYSTKKPRRYDSQMFVKILYQYITTKWPRILLRNNLAALLLKRHAVHHPHGLSLPAVDLKLFQHYPITRPYLPKTLLFLLCVGHCKEVEY